MIYGFYQTLSLQWFANVPIVESTVEISWVISVMIPSLQHLFLRPETQRPISKQRDTMDTVGHLESGRLLRWMFVEKSSSIQFEALLGYCYVVSHG